MVTLGVVGAAAAAAATVAARLAVVDDGGGGTAVVVIDGAAVVVSGGAVVVLATGTVVATVRSVRPDAGLVISRTPASAMITARAIASARTGRASGMRNTQPSP